MLCSPRVSSTSSGRCAARYALEPSLPSMRCVGYRQAWEYLDGRIDAPTLRAKGVAATRQLAKRQLTWLRATAAAVLAVPGDALVDEAARLFTVAAGEPGPG